MENPTDLTKIPDATMEARFNLDGFINIESLLILRDSTPVDELWLIELPPVSLDTTSIPSFSNHPPPGVDWNEACSRHLPSKMAFDEVMKMECYSGQYGFRRSGISR